MKALAWCFGTAACLSGCSGVPLSIAPVDPATTPTLTLAEFPGAVSAFDARSDDASWDAGDEVLFALRLRKGDEVHRWLLRLDVVLGERLIARVDGSSEQKIELWEDKTWTYQTTAAGKATEHKVTSKMLPIGVTVSDASGQLLAKSRVRLPS